MRKHSRGVGVPVVEVATRDFEAVPVLVALGDGLVCAGEELGQHVLLHHLRNLGARGPDVAQEHILAVTALAKRLAGKVDVDLQSEARVDDVR